MWVFPVVRIGSPRPSFPQESVVPPSCLRGETHALVGVYKEMAGTERPAQGRKSQELAYPVKKKKKLPTSGKSIQISKRGGKL
jgi:hypothetical protein